jgi:FKBP-type peptidyl-prolyl cis-trans isomerase (trigger factor)
MTVNQENIEKWGAFLQVNIATDDYSDELKKKLTEQQKKTVLKGFRPGMVPMAMVKKMYGTHLTIDAVNRIVSEQLEKYIKDNDLKILGQPIPAPNKEIKADWDNPSDFVFWFEVAFIPTLKFSLTDIKAKYYDIEADEETVTRQIDSLKSRFSEGKDVKDVVLDTDFFKKAYPNDNIKNEKELREKIRTEIEQFYTYDADRTFSKDVFDAIAKATETGIPKEFLMRWIEFHNEQQKTSTQEIEKHFDEYEKSLKKQLAESQIIKDENITIEREDIRTYYKEDVLSKYYPVGSDDPAMQEQIEKITDGALAEPKNMHQLYGMLLDKHILALFKEKVKAKHEKISFNKFMEIAYGAMTTAAATADAEGEHVHSEDCGCNDHDHA